MTSLVIYNSYMSESFKKFEQHLDITHADMSVVEHLATICDLSRSRLKQALQKGAVWISQSAHTRRIRRASKQLEIGDTLHFYYDEKVLSEIPPRPLLIADEEAYSVWYKPYGLRSQGSKWGDHCTINRWVEQNFNPQRPAFIVHRLDRAATGLIIIAHSRQAAAAFSKAFSDRLINKHYQIVVHGCFPDQLDPIKLDSPINGKIAVTYVQRLIYDEALDRSLLRIKIETGRKHQIRIHLSEYGFPVLGDRLYGNANDHCDLQLTAYELAFECPLSGEMKHYLLDEDHCPKISV